MIKLIVAGANGRMGQEVNAMALQDKAFGEIFGFDKDDNPSAIRRGDVLVDFTTPAATLEHLQIAEAAGKPVIIGTTGFTDKDDALIQQYSKKIPIVKSSNMSLGMNLLFKLAQLAALKLRPNDIQMEETHHVHKKDSPSGSAKTIKDFIVQADPKWGKIKILSHREGEVVGEHSVKLVGWEEELFLAHSAKSRKPFAAGALHAAKWIVQQKPGLYDMQDVLGL